MTSDWNLAKIKQQKASEICGEIDLTQAARDLLSEDLTPAQYLKALSGRSLYVDAVRMLAHALPKREAVWWACLCARKVLGADAASRRAAAVHQAERWVYRPTEENRRAAMEAAEVTKFDSAAGWAAAAAAWSGGSMAPADCPTVLPPEDLTARAVVNAVMLAAVAGDPQQIVGNYQLFFRQGINIAEGGNGRLQSA